MHMKLPSHALEAFAACAELTSFTKAARKLHITQSALSQRIMNLEELLGLTLFIREKSGPRLTEAGAHLLRFCQMQEALEGETLALLKGGDPSQLTGQIRIGGFSTSMRSLVLPALAKLLCEQRQLQLQMCTKEMEELPPLLKSGQIDFMILDHVLEHEDLTSVLLGHESNVLIQKKNYQGPKVYLDHDENDQTTLRYLKLKKMALLDRHYLDDIDGLIEGVRLGLGLAVVPRHLLRVRSEQIEEVPGQRTLSIPHVLHFYTRPYYTEVHKQVVQLLISHFAQALKSDT